MGLVTERGRGRRLGMIVATGGACLAIASGCGIGGDDDDGADETAMSDSRCVPASEAVVETISGGLDPGLSIEDPQVVQSDDYMSAYFVSARIAGAAGEPIATWVVTDPEDVGDLIFSVTEPAKRNSTFSTANNSFSGLDDGVAESQGCAEIR